MSASDPKSWIDQLVGACLGLLGGAIALYCAVQVIEAVLPFLVAVIGIATLTAGAIAAFQWYRQRW
ncbi:hypothetical protein FK531_07525 [Rhodococcus spelaei]|uniref:Uncharacterized protein n=1 Tax=Rhodococcus spelaei TaxID=2546320 RepID=A0A541BM71_9NOCA|nr:hypothetical protein [Rhodococcus spelaei]TQF73354.1 hypothetical protein FK531_07525 [Rhodococcus spelaei]